MGLVPRFTNDFVKQLMESKKQAIRLAIIANLKRLGNECVAIARQSDDYKDQTGNLRSSIGFIIVVDGVVVESFFDTANKDTNGTGVNTGRAYAEDLSRNYNKGFALIVVAGMNYAALVESKSKDVLTSAEKYAKKNLPKMIKSLKSSIKTIR